MMNLKNSSKPHTKYCTTIRPGRIIFPTLHAKPFATIPFNKLLPEIVPPIHSNIVNNLFIVFVSD